MAIYDETKINFIVNCCLISLRVSTKYNKNNNNYYASTSFSTSLKKHIDLGPPATRESLAETWSKAFLQVIRIHSRPQDIGSIEYATRSTLTRRTRRGMNIQPWVHRNVWQEESTISLHKNKIICSVLRTVLQIAYLFALLLLERFVRERLHTLCSTQNDYLFWMA